MKRLAAGLLVMWLASPAAVSAECFDVSQGEPSQLTGKLEFRIFAGPPNFEDVRKGDAPEPGYVLILPEPICLSGDDGFTDPFLQFDEVQLVETGATAVAMRDLRGQAVSVALADPIPAMTGHHHRPLVAWVTAIASSAAAPDHMAGGDTTVTAFYLALGAGDGDTAASFVVPEKTMAGPLSASELSRFYGQLREPLELIEVTRVAESEYLARYRFAAASSVCDGRALVRTESRGGRLLISAIKALDGC